ncbi:hypothetical protein CISIN_1g032409mg [Citrus sinensis]|uniref:PHD finger protein ALFIN-LIKE n=1 Tax=Citrus sinensis TaxID=2711 RepID=A0A067DET6_CITSI|nr:hypothetical protein CISIN_1g032409mg [Citrus sinensis]
MQEKDWLSLVAVHSDSWLLAVAFYFGARFGFGKNERKKLFQMINDLPTIFEVVTGNAKQPKDQSANHNSSKSKSSGKSRPAESQTKAVKMSPPPKDDDDSGMKKRKMMNRAPPVEHAGITMALTNSGSAAISVRNGSTANV